MQGQSVLKGTQKRLAGANALTINAFSLARRFFVLFKYCSTTVGSVSSCFVIGSTYSTPISLSRRSACPHLSMRYTT